MPNPPITNFVSESAPYATTCDRCGKTFDARVTEALVGDDHRWDLDAHCPHCDLAWCECAIEPATAGMRNAILAANGFTVLKVEKGSVTTASVMRAVRIACFLSLSEARSVADELVTSGRAGSLVEVEVLARLLRASGAVVSTWRRGEQGSE
ncbi:hypothetical protein AB0H71_06180 [Nocardia sp. NPDC050697]|uniref:hypothetical protein n=1 Tax=Nocardia sp. NPDC050697 TaxID=3155158 RepID=UPI0033D9210A